MSDPVTQATFELDADDLPRLVLTEIDLPDAYGDGQTLVGLEQIEPRGFYDEAVGLKTLHDSSGNMVSSTVIDFRVGRILGVVFVATVGDHLRLGEATELGIAMEKQIVSVALGASLGGRTDIGLALEVSRSAGEV